jgi:hypothetical protein
MRKDNGCLNAWYLSRTQLHSAYKDMTVVKLTQNGRQNVAVKWGYNIG